MFVLVPGAGGMAWYWHRVVPELQARGHEAVAVDLPGPDERAGLPEYTDAVIAAIDGHDDVVVVAQSMGGFTAAMACARVPVELLVLVNAMIPRPGETPGQWWENTGWQEARVAAAEAGGYGAEFDLATYFLHDVPAEVAAEGAAHERPEADVAFGQPCDIDRWPAVATRVVAAAADRFFSGGVPAPARPRAPRNSRRRDPWRSPGRTVASRRPGQPANHLHDRPRGRHASGD